MNADATFADSADLVQRLNDQRILANALVNRRQVPRRTCSASSGDSHEARWKLCWIQHDAPSSGGPGVVHAGFFPIPPRLSSLAAERGAK